MNDWRGFWLDGLRTQPGTRYQEIWICAWNDSFLGPNSYSYNNFESSWVWAPLRPPPGLSFCRKTLGISKAIMLMGAPEWHILHFTTMMIKTVTRKGKKAKSRRNHKFPVVLPEKCDILLPVVVHMASCTEHWGPGNLTQALVRKTLTDSWPARWVILLSSSPDVRMILWHKEPTITTMSIYIHTLSGMAYGLQMNRNVLHRQDSPRD